MSGGEPYVWSCVRDVRLLRIDGQPGRGQRVGDTWGCDRIVSSIARARSYGSTALGRSRRRAYPTCSLRMCRGALRAWAMVAVYACVDTGGAAARQAAQMRNRRHIEQTTASGLQGGERVC